MGKGGWCLEACEEETTPADLCSGWRRCPAYSAYPSKIRLLSPFGKLATAVEPPRVTSDKPQRAGQPSPRGLHQGLSWVASFS